jgi:rhamnosyltransferase
MNRLLCYAHHDERGTVRPFVKHALATMAPLCSGRVFVSNSPLAERDLEELRALCGEVVVGDNAGYDFFMWKRALQTEDCGRYDEVVLMNSSVYGPLFPMEGVFAEMDGVDCDFWGITECFRHLPHLQTYFLVFRKKVLSSPRFRMFWDGVLPYTEKRQVILGYEAGLTRWLVESGFRPAAYCDFDRLGRHLSESGKRLRRDEIVSSKYAAELLRIGSPFLKRDAVRNGIAGREEVRGIPGAASYPIDDIGESAPGGGDALCPVCGAPGKAAYRGVRDFPDRFNPDRYDYFRCGGASCGVLWRHPPLPAGDAAAGPPGSVPAEILTPTAGGPEPGKVLVVGCRNAGLLAELGKRGWDAASAVDAEAVECGRFDRVLLVRSLERSADPSRLLAGSFRALKPGGALCIATPNASAASRLLFGRYWSGLDAPRHRVIHTSASLRNLLSSAGFRSIRIETTTRSAEECALRSLDGMRDKWAPRDVSHRIGKETLPRVLRLLFAAVNGVTGRHGDAILATAVKPS